MRARTERLVRGDTWQRVWLLRDAGGEPIDLSGGSARMQLRSGGGATLVECSTANGRLTIDGPAGRIDLALPWEEAEALAPGRYVYDLEVTLASGQRQTCDRAVLLVVEDITR